MSKRFERYGQKPPEDRTEQEGRQLRWRSSSLILLFAGVLVIYGLVLYDLQVVNGSSYLDQAFYTTAQTETVDSVRGEILDSFGRVLVTNTTSYQVRLDTSVMGTERNQILTDLVALCREEGVEWADSFPVSATAPYTFTKGDVYTYLLVRAGTGEDGAETETTEERRTNLGALAVRYKWIADPLSEELAEGAVTYLAPQALMEAMCKTFGIELPEAEEGSSPVISQEVRALLGVLYELSLRSREVVYTEYVFAEGVDISFISKVKERKLTGVEVESADSRQYLTKYAAHVLGRVAAIDPQEWPDYQAAGYAMDAYVGKMGVEKAFEDYLRGKSGVREIVTSNSGKLISQNWVEEPDPGSNVTLTLDIGLQAVAENALASHVQSLEGSEGAAVAIVDMTGGVLTLASYPAFDLSTFSQDYNELAADTRNPMLNRATNGLYSPGSTFKLVTATAGLMEGIITPRNTIYCGGSYTYEGWRNFRAYCHRRAGHGTENLAKAIKDSCNVYFYDVGRRVGIEKLNEYAAAFGLGEHTGIEIGDSAGRVAGPETSAYFEQAWNEGATVYAAIGQENNQFTPLQLANYVATLVNGGDHYAAHLLKSVKSADYSQVLYEYEPQLLNALEIPEQYLSAIKQGMYEVSQNSAIARYFNQLPVRVGAKTGTAELTAGVDNKNTNGLLVVFAPYEDPQIAMCILMQGGTSGSSLASVAYDILDYYFSRDAALSSVTLENALLQ